MGVLLLDLSKVFDAVPHQSLLSELASIGCIGGALRWFQCYLTDSTQRVAYQAAVTPWKSVTRGVPRGSCLSPLLFKVYVRSLPLHCQSKSIQFADDTTHSGADHFINVLAVIAHDQFWRH